MKKQYSKSKNTCKVTFSLPAEATTGASSVTLLGDFNEWKEEAGIPLKPQKDGSYKTQVELTTGRIATFTLAMSGWQINEPAGDGAVIWTVFGKQSGDVMWSIASKTAMKKAA